MCVSTGRHSRLEECLLLCVSWCIPAVVVPSVPDRCVHCHVSLPAFSPTPLLPRQQLLSHVCVNVSRRSSSSSDQKRTAPLLLPRQAVALSLSPSLTYSLARSLVVYSHTAADGGSAEMQGCLLLLFSICSNAQVGNCIHREYFLFFTFYFLFEKENCG